MADQESTALANPPVAPTPPTPAIPSYFDGLRVRAVDAAKTLAAVGNQVTGNTIGFSTELGRQIVNQVSDPQKRADMIIGMASGTDGENIEPMIAPMAEGVFKGLRVRPAEEIMTQPLSTSRATPTGESSSLPPELHATLESQAGKKLTPDEAVALDRANLERGMATSSSGDTSNIRESKRSELARSHSEQPRDIVENAGLKYKGELVKGSGVHMFEHPDHPGKTAALDEKDVTPEKVTEKMAAKLRDFGVGNTELRAGLPQIAETGGKKLGTKDSDPASAIISENRGIAKVYKPGNVDVIFASPDRLNNLKKTGGGDRQLEFWAPSDEGTSEFPRPSGHDGKRIVEIYNTDIKNDPKRLKDAIYGDMLHGMVEDPYFASLRNEFTKNYPPAIKDWNDKAIKSGRFRGPELDDMYIRGRLAERQGDEWKSPDRYSGKQLQILEEMKKYLKTGEPSRDFGVKDAGAAKLGAK